MGKIIPFQIKQQSLYALTNILLSRIRTGKFKSESSYSKAIIKHLETCGIEDITAFLLAITPLVEALKWKKADLSPIDFEEFISEHGDVFKIMTSQIDLHPQLQKIRDDIYKQLFSDDHFLDKLQELLPLKAKVHRYVEIKRSVLGETNASNIGLQNFIAQCFKIVILRYGLLEQLMCIDLFSSFSLTRELPEAVILNLLKKHGIKSTENVRICDTFEKLAEKYLSAQLSSGGLAFVDLYRLLILRHRLKRKCNDVCNALIDAVAITDLDDIIRALESDTDFSYDDIEGITYTPKYSEEPSEFHHDLYIALHDAGKFDYEIAFNAFLFFAYDFESCPLGLLMLGSTYHMDEIPGAVGSYAVEGFLAASKIYSAQSLYEEAMLCFKTALFNIIYLFGAELEDRIDMSYYKEITRKLNCYEKSIAFLSKFSIISKYGFPMNQGLLNEIEITRAEIEYEFNSRSYHKIDEFYELVAKEDFHAIQSYVGVKHKGRFVLTGNQLQILLKKVQEKSDIIQGLKSISAKCDMLMYMHREVYDKQAAILEAVKENEEALSDIISRNTEKIIENIHKKNESFERQINFKACQEFYYELIGNKLWAKLDEGTRKYLLLGKHLDSTNQYSPSDECGYIAIEYALAIENEFKIKLIDSFLTKAQHIKYKAADKSKIIDVDSKITMGEICTLMDKARKIKSSSDMLWPFYSFVERCASGGRKVFDFKNELFAIKTKYRNPAAHPSNYTRTLLDSFKELLFQKGFMKGYFEAIQIQSTE